MMETPVTEEEVPAPQTEEVQNGVFHIDGMEKRAPPVPPRTDDYQIKDVTDIVGPFGPWQLVVFLTVVYVEVVAAIYNYASPLLAPTVKYTCNLNDTLDWLKDKDNVTYESITLADMSESKDHCSYSVNGTTFTDSARCPFFNYNTVYTRSATEEWQLICEDSWKVSFTSSMTLLGDLVACLVFGHLADIIGRRKTMWIALLTTIVAPLVVLFSNTYIQFVIGRFLCGASGFGFMIISYVMMMEIIGVRYRAVIGIMVKVGYTIGGVYVGLIAWWLRDWFNIQIASTIPVIILVILCYIIPESPRWLISNGYKDVAEKVLEKGAKWNKKSTKDMTVRVDRLSEKILSEMQNNRSTYTAWDLMLTPNTRWKTLILVVAWAVSIFVYYGISLNSSTFSNDMFISFISICAVEIPAHILCILGTHYLGCKYSLIISFMFTAVICFIGAGTQITTGWQGILIVSLMKMGITGATDISYNISAEIFPTVVRAIGMGICSTVARAAAMVSPFMKEVATATSVSVPSSLFGVLCFFTGLLIFLLPNTHNKLLPETMVESEKIGLEIPCRKSRTANINMPMTNYGIK